MNKKSQPDAQGYHPQTAPASGHSNVRETSEGSVSLTPTPEGLETGSTSLAWGARS